MFGKLMNSYYYGKSGKGDFQKDDLPKNRWQLFWEMLRVRLSGLFRMNMMCVVAWIPIMYLLSVLIFGAIGAINSVTMVQEGAEGVTDIDIQIANDFTGHLNSLLMSTCLFLIPAIAITGPFSAGMAYVTRNWARDEHAFVWSDFKDALKANWKQALAVSTITGFIPLIAVVCWQFYGNMAQQNILFIVPQMLVVSLSVVWLLGLVFMYPMMVTYTMKFRQLVKNSLMLAIARLPQTVGVRLVMLVPTLIAAAVMYFTSAFEYALLALAGYYLLIGNGLARFVFASFTNSVFDKYINPHIEGAEVGRGLSQEDDDEDEPEEQPTEPQ